MKGTALVTGAAGGIGFATAVALAEEGFDIAALDLAGRSRLGDLQVIVEGAGRRFLALDFDLADLDGHEAALAAVYRHFGSLECLVNNAGVSVLNRGDLLDVSRESYDRCFAVNTRGSFFFTQAAARRMAALNEPPPGTCRSIIFVTSSNAVAASVERGEYCMSKTSLSMACKLFAQRLAPHGIAVFEVQPGVIMTEMTAPAREKYDRRIADGLLVDRRWGQPEDVARCIRSMAAGLLPYTVAQEVRVDGGLLLTRF